MTEQSFPEICRNDWSVNETIWTPRCDKLHVFDMVEKINRKKFVRWIFSLHTTKFYEAKVNSFCMSKLLIKINIVQTQLLFSKTTHSVETVYKKFFSGKKGNQSSISKWFILPTTHLHVNALTHVPFITSFTNEQSVDM